MNCKNEDGDHLKLNWKMWVMNINLKVSSSYIRF
jgi:hypothetical protein